MIKYKICKRCVMDTSDPLIQFDENGNCNHCNDFLNVRIKYVYNSKKSDDVRKNIISHIKKSGKNNLYDCVIGLSGGVDSSYVAYLCKSYGLRILAVHMDNGWNTLESVQNIRNVCSKLEIDYECEVLDWENFKNVQISFLKASVPEAETPTDIAILSVLHKYAAKYNIKYIISGGNFASEGILPKSWHYNAKDKKYFGYIVNTFNKRKIKNFPTFGVANEVYFKFFKRIRMVYLLNLVNYNKDEAIKLLEKELNWKNYGGKHRESRYTAYIQSYYLYKKFGIDYRRATYSSLICMGYMDRDEALKNLVDCPYNSLKINEDIEYIAKKIGISKNELNAINVLQAKYYFDYPNNEKQLSLVYNVYRKIFKKEKLASS